MPSTLAAAKMRRVGGKEILTARTQNFYPVILCTKQWARGIHILLILSFSDPVNLASPAVSGGGRVCSQHLGKTVTGQSWMHWALVQGRHCLAQISHVSAKSSTSLPSHSSSCSSHISSRLEIHFVRRSHLVSVDST